MDAQNVAAQFGADAQNQFARQNQQQANRFALGRAGLAQAGQQQQYGQAGDLLALSTQRKGLADQARQDATGALLGGVGALMNPLGSSIGTLMGKG